MALTILGQNGSDYLVGTTYNDYARAQRIDLKEGKAYPVRAVGQWFKFMTWEPFKGNESDVLEKICKVSGFDESEIEKPPFQPKELSTLK